MGFSGPTMAKSISALLASANLQIASMSRSGMTTCFVGFFDVEGVSLLICDEQFHFVVWASAESVNHGGFSCTVRNDQYAYFLH